jgi:sugar lactone lactonase YvrE
MKKVLSVWIAAMMLLANGCYKDDINDLQDDVDRLRQEQQAQAEKMKTYETLLNALQNNLSVTSVAAIENGTRITFSDGSSIDVVNGSDAAAVVSVEEFNGEIYFRMSDGTVIKLHKIETVALYILSEGSRGDSSSDLAYYDVATGTFTAGYYSTQNGSPLGDTGNDLKLYGSKMYCAVSGYDMTTGGVIRVIDPKTGKLIKNITATDAGGKPDQPRRIALAGGKVYFSMYSGAVLRVDTASLEITGHVKLDGTYSEGICAYGDRLYVCNSGWGTGNTISVVDIASFAETATITVPQNPNMIEATATGDIYFTTADYSWAGGAPSNLYKFNAANTQNIVSFDIRATRLAIGKEYVYTVETDWAGLGSIINRVNLATGVAETFDTEEDLPLGYSVSVNPTNGDIYFTNQMGQDVYAFNQDGKQVLSLKTGVHNGSSIVFINR